MREGREERVIKYRVRTLVTEERNRREVESEAGRDSIQPTSQVDNGIAEGVTDADRRKRKFWVSTSSRGSKA
jgi:hypothetical protein